MSLELLTAYNICNLHDNKVLIYFSTQVYIGFYAWDGRYCNGVVISHRHVLTVLHCLYIDPDSVVSDILDNDELFIKLNITNIKDHNDSPTFTVKSIIIHPSYNLNAPTHELVILELNETFRATDTSPICLPMYNIIPVVCYHGNHF